MSLPFVPGIAERMEELGYDQLLRAYEDKYGKKYPPFRIRHRDLCCAGHGKVYCRRNRHAQGCGSARGLTVSHTLHRKATGA